MPSLFGVLLSWFPMLLLIAVWIFFMRQMQGGKGGAEEGFDGYTVADFFGGFAAVDRRPLPPRMRTEVSSLARGSTSRPNAVAPPTPLLKLRDFPRDRGFRDVLPDHFDDLMRALPYGAYTRTDGHYNLAAYLPDGAVPPDLGPKCYCAYGKVGADAAAGMAGAGAGATARPTPPGTTCLHADMADAVNVLVHVETAGSGASDSADAVCGHTLGPDDGAVWHIFSQDDTRLLHAALPAIVRARGRRDGIKPMLESTAALFDACIYLDEPLLDELRDLAGISPYVVVQALGDALLIPAGCAHQVRNVRSCIKVAADFVAPEHVSQCVWLTEELRQLPEAHPRRTDVLNVRSIVWYATCACLATLDDAKRRERIPSSERREPAAPQPAAPGEKSRVSEVAGEVASALGMLAG